MQPKIPLEFVMDLKKSMMHHDSTLYACLKYVTEFSSATLRT